MRDGRATTYYIHAQYTLLTTRCSLLDSSYSCRHASTAIGAQPPRHRTTSVGSSGLHDALSAGVGSDRAALIRALPVSRHTKPPTNCTYGCQKTEACAVCLNGCGRSFHFACFWDTHPGIADRSVQPRCAMCAASMDS